MLNEFKCSYSEMYYINGVFSGKLSVELCDGLYLYTVSTKIRTERNDFHYLADMAYEEAKNIITTLIAERRNHPDPDYDISIERIYPGLEHNYLYSKR